MPLLTLYHDARVTLAANRLVYSPEDLAGIEGLSDEADVLHRLVEDERERIEKAANEAREAGYERGQNEGYEAALEHIAVKLVALSKEAEEARERLHAQAAELALSIVSKIAREMGTPDAIAALAISAARQLAPHETVVLHVHPEQESGVRERLISLHKEGTRITEVTADPTLKIDDCVLETEFGSIRAGLETQLTVLRERLHGRT